MDAHEFRLTLIKKLAKIKNLTKWAIAIEPIIVREGKQGVDPIEVGNRLLYSIIDQQMNVENHVIPAWLSMLIAGIDILALSELGEDGEEILSAIFYSHGLPRFYTSSDFVKRGKSIFSSLPFALVRSAINVTHKVHVLVNGSEIVPWRNLNEFSDYVKSIISKDTISSEKKKKIFIKGLDKKDKRKLFPLMGERVTNFFLRDIDIRVNRENVPIKIDVNNLKSGKTTGFFFPDDALVNILESRDILQQKDIYIKTLVSLRHMSDDVFIDIIRKSSKDSLEAKDLNRMLFILGSDFCDTCLQHGNSTKCPIVDVCLLSMIAQKLSDDKRIAFVKTAKQNI